MNPKDSQLVNFDGMWDFNRPAESEKRFQTLLPQAAAFPAYHAELLTQIARAQGLQGRYESAHETLNRAENLLTAEMPRARIRYYLERGRVYVATQQVENALSFFTRAWELAQSYQDDYYAVDAAYMLATMDTPERQLEWHFKALERARRSSNPSSRRWQASILNNIGWHLFERGDMQAALDAFEKALDLRQLLDVPAEVHFARWCVAKTLRVMQRLDEALGIQKELEKEMEQAGEEDGFIYEELAECLLAKGEGEEALEYFQKAFSLLSKDRWLAQSEPARYERLRQLAAHGRV